MEGAHAPVTVQDLLGRQLNDVEKRYAPGAMYCAGPMSIPLTHTRVSVVGSRRASGMGLAEAASIVDILAENGVTIVSGLARGIDAVAHQRAMDCGGRTVAVIGTPLDRAYPRENAALQDMIMRRHLAVSQFPAGHSTRRGDFVLRNRTMALISNASVIVEAGDGSGSLHHGWEAIRLGRPLFIPGRVMDDAGLEWPGRMAEYGAIRLVEYGDILDWIPPDVETPRMFRG